MVRRNYPLSTVGAVILLIPTKNRSTEHNYYWLSVLITYITYVHTTYTRLGYKEAIGDETPTKP